MWHRTLGTKACISTQYSPHHNRGLISISSGTFLPQAIAYGTVAPTNDGSFLIVGGNYGNGQLDTIYKYSVDGERWDLLPKRLPRRAEKLTAMMIGWQLGAQFPTCNGVFETGPQS